MSKQKPQSQGTASPDSTIQPINAKPLVQLVLAVPVEIGGKLHKSGSVVASCQIVGGISQERMQKLIARGLIRINIT